jgi:hypothetical protein
MAHAPPESLNTPPPPPSRQVFDYQDAQDADLDDLDGAPDGSALACSRQQAWADEALHASVEAARRADRLLARLSEHEAALHPHPAAGGPGGAGPSASSSGAAGAGGGGGGGGDGGPGGKRPRVGPEDRVQLARILLEDARRALAEERASAAFIPSPEHSDADEPALGMARGGAGGGRGAQLAAGGKG